MVELLANKITLKFIENNIIDSNDKDIYCYCFETTIVSFISISTLMLLSILFNELYCSMIFLIAFSFFRKICGGYHADNYIKCSIMSLLSYTTMVVVLKKINILFKYNIYLLIIGLIIILFLSPIQDENKPFTEKQMKRFKILSKSIATILLIIFIVLQACKLYDVFINQYFFAFVYGIDLVAYSLLKSKIERSVLNEKNK